MTISSLATQLPPEILQDIVLYLSWKKLPMLTTICRSWNRALIPLLYRSVSLRGDEQFRLFFDALKTTVSHKQLSQHVRELSISCEGNSAPALPLQLVQSSTSNDSTTEKTYIDFLLSLPGMDSLAKITMDGVSYTDPLPSTKFFQDCLTVLSLDVQAMGNWCDMVTKFRSLQKLSLRFALRPMQGEISLQDFEKLHDALIHLRCFEVTAFSPFGDPPEHITPCDSVRDLTLSVEACAMWGPYFSRKYTNLETLEIDSSRVGSLVCDETKDLLIQSCRQLKTVLVYVGEDYNSFLDVLETANAPVRHIQYSFDAHGIIPRTMHSFQQTLAKVQISSCYVSFLELLERLKECPCLVDLQLYRADLEVDRILDELPGLQHLSLRGCYINVSRQSNNQGRLHKQLRSLELETDEIDWIDGIDNEVFVYLSQYCPCLVSLECRYYNQHNHLPVIYYPHRSLKHLSVTTYCRSLFKLVRTDDPEVLKQWSKRQYGLISSIDGERSHTQWFDVNTRDGPLQPSEAEEIIQDLRDRDENALYANMTRTRYDRRSDMPIISILCRYVDEITVGLWKVIS
ncbi:hypothetical protein EC973_003002 [Apophysomyces ossiformis]|uniref:F-box domain-containing protein n=1 Tax=Apophysomyces ossiformis TaxID=679940 RepID=A0A8H7BTU0_9FUNG|nr:hypothetical protein EC973_003002 [Apophysomyces ossiformis]